MTQDPIQNAETAEDQNISAIRETTILVSFHGGFFPWKRRDSEIEREIAAAKNTKADVGQYFKNIFAGSDNLLNSTKALITEARAYHYDVTLPSPWEGEAFLRNTQIAAYKAKMIEFEHRLEGLNAQIEFEWTTMQQTARNILGPMFKATDYPTVQEVHAKNYITVNFKPIPSGNFVIEGIDEDLRAEISSGVDAQVREAFKAANLEAWKRLLDVINNARVNLAKTNDGRFRGEWHDNLAGLLSIMDGLNITNDADLHDMAEEAKKLLDYDINDLRDDWDARQRACTKAESIFDQMSSIYSSIGGKR